MKPIVLPLLCLALAGPVAAQQPAAPVPPAATASAPAGPSTEQQQVAAERARIAAERERVEREFEAAQKACYQKFAVTGCIEDARAKRRDVLADLRRQEVALNDAQRRARAAEQMRSLEQRQAEQERKAQEAQHKGQEEAAKRERRAAEKDTKPSQDAEAASRRAKTPHQPQPTQAPDVQANRERYDRRVADAEEHKAQVQRRAASAKKDVKPLPVPP